MSIDDSGFNSNITAGKVTINIETTHPLVELANVIDWQKLMNFVLPDLKQTTKKGKWWMGRALHLRVHLGAYLLQQLFNKTDRQIEYELKDNAAYQLFCGMKIVKKWHAPDHTKIEEFRSRLCPDTQKKLANAIANNAVSLGFASPLDVDIDSTIQEANMAYPSDSNLLCKLSVLAKKTANYMNNKIQTFAIKPMDVNLKRIKSYARRYFFLPKTTSKDDRNKYMRDLFDVVSEEINLVISNARCMSASFVEAAPWNIKRAMKQIINLSQKYLADVEYFICNRVIEPTKRLSFHLSDVKCLTKNKPGKKYFFGKTVQLGRITGNFLFVGKYNSINAEDKKSIQMMVDTHAETFPDFKIHSLASDKGYYSRHNEKIIANNDIKECGIQRPTNIKSKPINPLTKERENELIDRRSGIEALIGHVKHGGQLGRSRMKSDRTIEASAYTSVLGFNLRQMIRCATGK